MTTFLYFIGLLLGLAVFIYLLSIYEKGKKKLTSDRPVQKKTELKPSDVMYKNLPTRAPGERMCPVCGSPLEKYEALYASKIQNGDSQKILIHGCRHCYKDNEDPEQKRKSDY